MKSIQNIAAIIFIIAVVILSAVSIFGVWDFFSRDVITKSFQTLGWLVLVSIIVMVASQFIEKQPKPSGEEIIDIPNPMFKTIRRVTLSMLIVSVSLIALLGVLTIWEIIHDKQVLYKSFSSLAILAFMAFIIVLSCLERENKFKKIAGNLSVGLIIGIIFLGFVTFKLLGLLNMFD